MAEPRELQATDLMNIEPSGSVDNGGIYGVYESGTILPAIDGKRYFYGTAGNECIYIQAGISASKPKKLGSIYAQQTTSFKMDIGIGGVSDGVAQRTTATKSVIKNFLDIYLGVLAVGGGPLAFAISGMNILVAGGKIKQNYAKYEAGMVEMLVAKKFCSKRMPVLYRVVLHNLLFGTLEKYAVGRCSELLSEAIPGPKVAGKLTGILLGKLTEDPLKKRFEVIKELLQKVLFKVADFVADEDGEVNEEQVADLAKLYVVPLLSQTGTNVFQGESEESILKDSQEIVRETARHAISIRTMFKRIIIALDAL